jgi:peptidoglycan/xylan/chitin deacetylase (PgdA/CDA1 family)
MTARTSIKRAVAWSLLRSGALSVHRRLLQRAKAIVLLYHRVNDEGDPFFPSLPVRHFRDQLEHVARHYRIEPLEAVLDWLAAGAPGPARVALTIDDGYPDTGEAVLPILERLGLPATLFLCTGPPESGQPLWIDRVRALIKHARATALRFPALGEGELALDSAAARLLASTRLVACMKHLPPPEIARGLATLEERLEPGPFALRVIGWDDVRRLAKGPVALGAHTHNHYLLSTLDDAEVASEISTSLELIQRRAGVSARTFAYPNGEPGDYDERSVAVLRRLGVRCALTTRHGFARNAQDPYEIARIYTTEAFLPLFAARISGLGLEERWESMNRPSRMVMAE